MKSESFISTGGLGDAFISFLKLRQINFRLDWLHVESTDKIKQPFETFFRGICDGQITPSFEHDSNYIENYRKGRWNDRIPVSSGIDGFCPLKGETNIVLHHPFLDLPQEKSDGYDVVIQCSAGAKNNRGWTFDPRELARHVRRVCNKKVAIVGSDEKFFDPKDQDNFTTKLDLLETCNIIKNSRLFVGLSGFLVFYALATRVRVIQCQIDESHNRRYFHEKWNSYMSNVDDRVGLPEMLKTIRTAV